MAGRFDATFNGGTLEHVFHIPNALTSMTRMLRPGGVVIHILPCNGWVDHGFYQISPTLMFDYYEAAGFEPLESALFSSDPADPGCWQVRSIRPGDLGDGAAGIIKSGIHLYLFATRRPVDAIERPIPIQRLYSARKAPSHRTPWFLPYTIRHGVKTEARIIGKVTIRNAQQDSGHCWAAQLSEVVHLGDDCAHPGRSPLILLENDLALGPTHSSHQNIRERGQGAYSHWGDALYFSSSDNSNPNANGRKYTALILSPPTS